MPTIPPIRLIYSVMVLGLLWAFACGGRLLAQEHQAPDYGEFPASGSGRELIGELIAVDPINRRGWLRPGGDVAPDRYNRFLGQPFALLPYGMVYYHGAPAELKDIPLGTVLRGVFYLPPKGDTSISKPAPKDVVERQRAAYFNPHTHALLLEDDVSYHRRHKRAWRVERLETSEQDGRRFLVASPVGEEAAAARQAVGEQKFCVDQSTRVWQGKEFASLEDVRVGQTVQVNLTWDPQWGYGKFHVLELWLDEKSLEIAAETQRQKHLRYQRYHWLPGWVDKVTYDATQPNGTGTVYVTLFGGLDPALSDELIASRTAQVAIAEPTLRTWRKDQDAQGGPLLEVKKLPDPPRGSSGVQIQVQVRQVLEGFRTGGIVRVGCPGFPAAVVPPEERVNGMEDRQRSPTGKLLP